MKKGIILFDIQDFLYQGMKGNKFLTDEVNAKQRQVLDVLHRSLNEERERRLALDHSVPVVDMFLPTGDGYYMLCSPDLESILDIAHCIMRMLLSHAIDAYFNVLVGEIHIFTDMTGRENATGFDLGYAGGKGVDVAWPVHLRRLVRRPLEQSV